MDTLCERACICDRRNFRFAFNWFCRLTYLAGESSGSAGKTQADVKNALDAADKQRKTFLADEDLPATEKLWR